MWPLGNLARHLGLTFYFNEHLPLGGFSGMHIDLGCARKWEGRSLRILSNQMPSPELDTLWESLRVFKGTHKAGIKMPVLLREELKLSSVRNFLKVPQ